MKTITLSEKDYQKLLKLIAEFDKVYGDENTIWRIDDLDALREIGQDVIATLRNYLEKEANYA